MAKTRVERRVTKLAKELAVLFRNDPLLLEVARWKLAYKAAEIYDKHDVAQLVFNASADDDVETTVDELLPPVEDFESVSEVEQHQDALVAELHVATETERARRAPITP